MFGYMLQDWITVQNGLYNNLTQADDAWLSFQRFQDLTFLVDVRAVQLGGATAVQMQLETAPAKDELLFFPMVAPFNLTVSASPAIVPVRLAAASATYPALARWVRWKVFVAAAPSAWGATFRITCAANAVGRGG
jgi:hypothetical protein